MAMDNFTRNYTVVLGLIVLGLLGWWAKSAWQPQVWDLNDVLESDPVITDYPYQFRVVGFDDGVATLSTPRSFQVPAMRFLQIIHPELNGIDQADPKMIAAQQDLIDHQKRAQGLILSQPGVDSVTWKLDVHWLADHGVQVPAGT